MYGRIAFRFGVVVLRGGDGSEGSRNGGGGWTRWLGTLAEFGGVWGLGCLEDTLPVQFLTSRCLTLALVLGVFLYFFLRDLIF